MFNKKTTLEWSVDGRCFRLIYDATQEPDRPALIAPDRTGLTLSVHEWEELSKAISRMIADRRRNDVKQRSAEQRQSLPANAGQPWTQDLDNELADLWRAGLDVLSLARHFQRTEGSISSRLVRLSLVPNREAAYERSRVSPEQDSSKAPLSKESS